MANQKLQKFYRRFTQEFSIWDIVQILLGAAISPLALQMMMTPHGLITGGVTGLSVLLQFVTDIPTWVWYTGINIPIFIAGIRFVSLRFFLYSLLGSGFYSVFLALYDGIGIYWTETNPLLNAIVGGMLSGVGIGIILRGKGSSGGTDIIGVILRQKLGFQIGEVMLAINLLVILTSAFITSTELAFYSAIAMVVSSKAVDKVMTGLGGSKTVMIISKNPDEIIQNILLEMHRGCTILKGEGAYTREDIPVLLVSVLRSQLPLLKEMVFKADAQAFFIVFESGEIYGKGFASSKSDF